MTARLRPFRPVPYGRFTLVAPLAVGGMGEIYLAKASFPGGLEKLCVIKKVLPHLAEDPEFLARFRDEAKILIQLQHGSIAQVFETGFEGNEFFIALEFVDGKDLRRVMQRALDSGSHVPPELALYVGSRILEALAYAHRRKDERGTELAFVHRDVSPQNVLLSYEGEVKVIDFGLAKSQLSRSLTRPSVVLGKFHYMAPEQARGGKVDRRADLYALGIILWELLAGRNPHEDTPPYEILERVGDGQVAPIQSVAPEIPGALAAVIDRSLQRDPALRFQSAEEMRSRLTEVLVAIRPDAGPDLLAHWLREQFSEEYEAERRLIAQVSGSSIPDEVLAAPASEPEATRAQADTDGEVDTDRFDRRQRPQHVTDTQRFDDPDETPGPEAAWWREPASRPRQRPQLRPAGLAATTSPVDLPWTPPGSRSAVRVEPKSEPAPPPPVAPLPQAEVAQAPVETTEPGLPIKPAEPKPTPARSPRRGAAIAGGAGAVLVAAMVVLLGTRAQAPAPPPVAAPSPPAPIPAAPPVAAVPAPPAMPEPRAVEADPPARAPEPVPRSVHHAAVAEEPRSEPSPSTPESDRKARLVRRREAVERIYEEMVARVGEEKVGSMVAAQKHVLDSNFDRLIESPDRYDELERDLAEWDRNVRERQGALR